MKRMATAIAILLASACDLGVANGEPPKALAGPPLVAGFALGESLSRAIPQLGPGYRNIAIGRAANWVRVLESANGSISLIATHLQGIFSITIRSRTAGALLDIRVGDRCGAPETLWGKPDSSTMNESANASWTFRGWRAFVVCDRTGRIVRMTIAEGPDSRLSSPR